MGCHKPGQPQAASQLDPGPLTRSRARLLPVPMAPATPVSGRAVSRPAAWLFARLSDQAPCVLFR